jgi:nondiscriminating glutamyl-tRNA synthetase
MSITTRFAPSPTGFLHVGGLRTALYAYIHAAQNNGRFILRIEDTDKERFVAGALEDIVASLSWAGIPILEGVGVDKQGVVVQNGSAGPYIQSQRLAVYEDHAQVLLAKGHAYHCFCTKERLDEVRTLQQLQKQPTGYDGLCRGLSQEEVKEKKAQGMSYVIRMHMPDSGTTSFTDSIRGEVSFENALIDDQVLIKTDGFPTYHFAVVVDDHLMGVTHVIRGEEWISSTPKHLALYAMFDWEPPTYAHLSLFVNADKQKMSKRHGDVSVGDFRRAGYLPEALINFVAFLGWNPGDEREIFTLPDLIQEFSFDRVQKTAAVFNREKLDWYNKEWMKRLSLKELADRAQPFFAALGIDVEGEHAGRFLQAVAMERERATTCVEMAEHTMFLFEDTLSYDAALLVWKKSDKETAKKVLATLLHTYSVQHADEWNALFVQAQAEHVMTMLGLDRGHVLWPMRVALSGKEHSPGPFEIAAALGREATCARLTVGLHALEA